MEKVTILNIHVTNTTKQQFVEQMILERAQRKAPLKIVTANPEIMMLAKENNHYEQLLQQSDHVVADGIGVVLGAKMLHTPLQERIPGYELVHSFLDQAPAHNNRFYFYGGKPGVAQAAAEKVKTLYPQAEVVGIADGYGGNGDEETVAIEISKLQPHYIFVALGAPKQEQWIADHAHRFQHCVMMGVGGSFDVLSGQVNRAPKIFIKLNLEWFHRLITQPTRAKRMLKIPQFLWAVKRQNK
ncbi:WecB/TagA/CpsF family glycosyltransferase [Kurthia sibirica]|uniref:N-acetylglucosaminyldiphosphoundecaprenol N-acetyl-beta-D-mannosaminyltransferase n=1 Tax=Kurthia sibirica TaxID=202750 RepID=A0A2U3AMK7_9BACL|nr:WecB/TagA/CpsF family glycosyltransferase [Kurthia sibirica]PWI25770.1 glycosyltransferase [Kurthia sibirica]GEK35627.1 acetylglucosaminyldiphosphoundecaprenol acetyl-beta-D-mannosaminyltransferase [Kurthia sibirica]